jgi:nucleotide-binding universal stress UspA family protein
MVRLVILIGSLSLVNKNPGDPKRILIDEAEVWRADHIFIFVGSTGMDLLERFLLGSDSEAVGDRACCLVEVTCHW